VSIASLAFAAVAYAFVGTTVIGVPSVVIYGLWLHLGSRVDDVVWIEESLELEGRAT